ncbi:substrate-binding domain-containing protein (plasmid) [Haloferacaceae archaeon DSL9]
MSKITNRRKFIRDGAVVGSIALAGCLSGDDDGGSSDGEGGYSVAVSIPDIEFQFFARQEREWDRLVDERDDVSGSFYDAQGSQEQQISDIETALVNDVDMIVVSPITEEGTVPAVQEANEAGVPIVNMDRTIVGADVTTHIASDNVEMGRKATNLALELMSGIGEQDNYNIIELQGTSGTSVANDRRDGFVEAINENDNLTELETQDADFSTSEAVSIVENFVTSHGDQIDGVYAHNDLMAVGAQQVIEDNDMAGVPIVGIDGDKAWVEQIMENEYYATIAQLPEEMLQESIDRGVQAIEGEEPEDFYEMETPELTQDNAREYYEDYLQNI